MKRYLLIFICVLLCAVLLTGCGVSSINAEDTVTFLLEKGYKLTVSQIEDTNFVIFDQYNLEAQYLSNFYESQKNYFNEIYADMTLNFYASMSVKDYNIQTKNKYDLVNEGENSWSHVILYACLFSAVTKVVEFWDVDNNGQPMWFVIFRCLPKTKDYDYADKLFKLFKDINQAVIREDGNPTNNKAFSWALNREVNIDKYENCIALYTNNASKLIK